MERSKQSVAVAVVAIGSFFILFRDRLSLAAAVAAEQQLRGFAEQNFAAAMAIAFALYVIVTALSLPGAAVMTLVCGWLFGFASALLLVSFAATTGATLAFLLSRYLFRDWVQARFGEKRGGTGMGNPNDGIGWQRWVEIAAEQLTVESLHSMLVTNLNPALLQNLCETSLHPVVMGNQQPISIGPLCPCRKTTLRTGASPPSIRRRASCTEAYQLVS